MSHIDSRDCLLSDGGTVKCPCTSPAQMTDGQVVEHTPDPRLRIVERPDSLPILPSAQEGLLHEVLGILEVAGEEISLTDQETLWMPRRDGRTPLRCSNPPRRSPSSAIRTRITRMTSPIATPDSDRGTPRFARLTWLQLDCLIGGGIGSLFVLGAAVPSPACQLSAVCPICVQRPLAYVRRQFDIVVDQGFQRGRYRTRTCDLSRVKAAL